MIQSFKDRDTKELFETGFSRTVGNIQAIARRKLDQLEAYGEFERLRTPPRNRLETLKGNRAGQYSIRINDSVPHGFAWKVDGAHDVEIADYH